MLGEALTGRCVHPHPLWDSGIQRLGPACLCVSLHRSPCPTPHPFLFLPAPPFSFFFFFFAIFQLGVTSRSSFTSSASVSPPDTHSPTLLLSRADQCMKSSHLLGVISVQRGQGLLGL